MANEVVLDIETQQSFGQAREVSGGRLSVSLVGIYRYETDTYETFLESELPKLWPILEHAERLIGFNTHGFDFPILEHYYPGTFKSFSSLDIMAELERALGHRVSLDNVARGTIGHTKISDGLQAIRLWHEGRLEELKEYCLNDVKLTRRVYEYGRDNRILKYESRIGTGEAAVDFSLPEKNKQVNLTLPL